MRLSGLLKRAIFGAASFFWTEFGALLNAIVMAKNDGRMPVPFGYHEDARHIVITASSHLKFLSDWICINDVAYSPGDMFIHSGLFLETVFAGLVAFWALKTLDKWFS